MANADDIPLVAHVVFRLDYGGLENGLVNLINNMPAHRYKHAIICLTTYSAFAQRIKRPGVSLIALNKKPGKDPACYLRMIQTLRRLRPSILHTRNFGTLDMQFAAALCGVPARIHGEHGWDVYDLNGRNERHRRMRRWASHVVHRYVAMSKDLAGYLHSDIGVSEQRIHQIYSGVDASKFRPATNADAAPWPQGFVSAGAVVIGTVGRLEPVKNPLALVRSFAHLTQKTPDASQRLRLALIGAGPMRDEVVKLVEQYGIQDITWVAGARDDVPELMRHLDIFVLPSLNEGISNTILEAMASGVPVVAGNVGGNPEIVRDGLTGRLYETDDELVEILQQYSADKVLRTKHGAQARATIESRHSIESMVDAYLRIYDTSLKRRS